MNRIFNSILIVFFSVAGTVDLSWRNNILDISITNFTDPELPHTNIRYTIGAFDSDSISTFNIKQPASGYWTTPNESVLKTSILVSDPDPGKNYTGKSS